MSDFVYVDPFPSGPDRTEYRKVDAGKVSTASFDGQEVLKVDPEALRLLAREAMRDVSDAGRVHRPHRPQTAAHLWEFPLSR